jgi:D-3-phosphoglycerate dehydrogenase
MEIKLGKFKLLSMIPGIEYAYKIFEDLVDVNSIWGKIDRSFTEDEIEPIITDYDAVIVWIDYIGERVLRAGKKLKVIGVPRAGYDNVNVKRATELGIPVIYAPGANSAAVADFVIGSIISLVRWISTSNHLLKLGRWGERWALLPKLGFNLEGKTLGIIGIGNIGARIAIRARAFGMDVIAYDPFVTEDEQTPIGLYPRELGIKMVSLNHLLRNSDIITIHVPLTERTKGMIGEREFEIMKDGVYIVNTSRGKIIDEKALVTALKSCKVAGAALDVFEKEPISKDNPLLKFDNVIVTPHIAWATEEALRRSIKMVAEGIVKVLKGERPNLKCVANPEVLK